jgi:hypothetical protein
LGAIILAQQALDLGISWFGGRMDNDWRPKSKKILSAMINNAGLKGNFWDLDG